MAAVHAPSLASITTSTTTAPRLPTYGITPPNQSTLTHAHPPSRYPNATSTIPSSNGIPLLPPREFARMHLEHVTAHPPDSVLFPFLHGLEGDNEAQCMFFASPSAASGGEQGTRKGAKCVQGAAGMVQDLTGRVVRPPRYRGLVWVLCEDDMDEGIHGVRGGSWEDEGEYDTDSEEYSSEEGEEEDVEMDIQDPETGASGIDVDAMDVDIEAHPHSHSRPHTHATHEKHMHPLTLRISTADHDTNTKTSVPFPSAPLDVAYTNGSANHAQAHDRRPSNASSLTDSESTYTSSSATSNSGSGSTSATSLPSPNSPLSCAEGLGSIRFALEGAGSGVVSESVPLSQPQSIHTTTSKPPSRPHTHHKQTPILTSTFLPTQLIQPCPRDGDWGGVDVGVDIDWEFKPAKVPEGISLRNFGVQVPLYTSLSDIVIYSPRGASPAALRLAARFRKAVERKRRERLQGWIGGDYGSEGDDLGIMKRYRFGSVGRGGGEGGGDAGQLVEEVGIEGQEEDHHSTPDGFLQYGVYVLDADASTIEAELGWMVMRKEGEEGTCFGCSSAGSATNTTNGDADAGCYGFECSEGLRRSGSSSHGLTESTDGRIIGEDEIEAGLETGEGGDLHHMRRHPHQHAHTHAHTHPYRSSGKDDHHSSHHQHPHQHRTHHSHSQLPSSTHGHHHPSNPHPNHNSGANTNTHSNLNPRRPHRCKCANTINFAQREKDEMGDLTRASEIVSVWDEGGGDEVERDHALASGSTTAIYWNPSVGQVFLGNASDVPLWTPPAKQNRGHSRNGSAFPQASSSLHSNHASSSHSNHASSSNSLPDEDPSPFDTATNDPTHGLGYDICIECHEYAPLPSSAHLRAAEEHVRALEVEWANRCRHQEHRSSSPQQQDTTRSRDTYTIPPRPPPHPSSIIHLPFPSSPQGTSAGLNALMPVIRFLERVVTPGGLGGGAGGAGNGGSTPRAPSKGQRLPSPWLPSHSLGRASSASPEAHTNGNIPNGNANGCSATETLSCRPRPLKILLYSSDGYTESSVPALCLLMAVKGLSLPEAYLEMQVVKRRSFFVYQSEVGLLKKVEARLGVGNGSFRSRYHTYGYGDIPRGLGSAGMSTTYGTQPMVVPSQNHIASSGQGQGGLRQLALSIPASSSAPSATTSAVSSSSSSLTLPNGFSTGPELGGGGSMMRRPRASTLPTFIPDHQSWFDDARFDGSFPSRVLPFLYLGNLNHASNAYMLHALGITHVVSVGECALVPPPQTPTSATSPPQAPTQSCPMRPSPSAQFVAGQGPGGQGSLWIEEREGRIKVLDIKGVCDDGIDTLEPQLHPICTWIEKARLAGGQVLVHCRVGVSRSATVTIAYVMQHLGLSLVEAYLVVRSRRLSVLIQPNMRLLYNLLGWEVRLARERAGGDERRLREELGRALSWPFLAREVHALNEKYLG
ncbi:hypothetical protein HYDPIDRAFT_38546 [Hydnomerulius pinastri MD-312]|nr:hypothetical protein HYDPIDRAFT_38546 [Hydnomerulius pinastri MD-312]